VGLYEEDGASEATFGFAVEVTLKRNVSTGKRIVKMAELGRKEQK
jgi:hypothetical protein